MTPRESKRMKELQTKVVERGEQRLKDRAELTALENEALKRFSDAEIAVIGRVILALKEVRKEGYDFRFVELLWEHLDRQASP